MSASRPFKEIQNDLETAIANSDYNLLDSLTKELKSIPSIEAEAWFSIGMGIIESIHGNFITALDHFESAQINCTDIGDKKGLAKAISNTGVIYMSTGNYISAIENLQKGRDLFKEVDDLQGVASTTANIGTIHMILHNSSAAVDHLMRAKDIFEELGQKHSVANSLCNLGSDRWDNGDIEASLEFHKEGYTIAKEVGNIPLQVFAGSSMVRSYMKLDNIDEAKRIYAAIADVELRNQNMKITRQMAKALIEAADEEFDLAHQTMIAALEDAQKAKLMLVQIKIHEELRELAQKRNDLQGYIQHNEAINRLKEESESSEKQRLIAIQEKEREMEEERKEHERERAVLYSTLPKHVADRVVRGEQVTDHFESASVMFLDIAGFTKLSSQIPPGHVVHLLQSIFSICDDVCEENGVTKVKTIGDSYMAAAGLSIKGEQHESILARTASEIIRALNSLEINMPPELGDKSWVKDAPEINVRIGLHCGPVVAGVVGKERLQYDVWGDTVNVASRMESTGEAGRIQVSETFANALDEEWIMEEREVEVKGKGKMRSYLISIE